MRQNLILKVLDRYKKRKCIEIYKKIVKHVQVNTKQLILFNNVRCKLNKNFIYVIDIFKYLLYAS